MSKFPLESLIEAILFFKGGSVTVSELVIATGRTQEEVESALTKLKSDLATRGLRLVRERGVALATAPETHETIEKLRKDELEGPLGKAGLETLSVVIYRGPIAKSDIDYIRGVNSASILRSLIVRGLVERIENPSDKRSFLYIATPELPAYLGVSELKDLPGYDEARIEVERIFSVRNAETSSEAELTEHES